MSALWPRVAAAVLATIVTLEAPATAQTDKSAEGDCVVLLHGLGRSETSLLVMEEMLSAAGFRLVNKGYPSTETTIDGLMDHVTEAGAGFRDRPARDACRADCPPRPAHEAGGRRGRCRPAVVPDRGPMRG